MKYTYKKYLALPITLLLALPAWSEDTGLDTIVVTASRNEMPLERVGSSLTVITAKEIEQRGYTNLADLLRTTPGVAVSNSGGQGGTTAIRIRGEEGFRTKILIDGVDVSDPSNTQVQAHVEHISLADVERIEILRGPQGMMYGADAGGVVNIITKRAHSNFTAKLSAEAGRYNTQNTSGSIGGKNNIVDYAISASNQSTDGFNSRTNDTVQRDNDGYDNTTFSTNVGVNITDRVRAEATLRNTNADTEFDNCGFPTTHNCETEFEQNSGKIGLSYKDKLTKQSLSYSISDIDRVYFTDNIKSTPFEGRNEQAQYIGTFNILEANTLLYGIDELKESILNDGADGEFDRNQTGIYAEWQGGIGSHFFYTLGGRNDDNDDFGNHSTYRTTAAWVQPIDNNELKLKSSYGTGFRAPSLYEIAYNSGPFAYPPASLVTLEEETSEGYDLGVEYHATSGLFLEAVYFNQDVNDAIDFDLATFSGYIQTSGTTNSSGVELAADIPVTDIVAIVGNYTYNDTETEAGDQRIRRPRHYGNIGARVAIQKFSVLGTMRFANDAEDEIFGIGRVKLDDYQVFDLSVNYAVTSQLELFARGQNIFDNDYQEVVNYNTAGAAFYAGVRASF